MNQHSAIPDDATCLGCGYALRDLPEYRCPECGREFDPAEAWSFHRGRHLKKWEQQLLKPPGWLLTTTAATAGMVTLWSFSPPAGVYGGSLYLAVLLWFVVGLAWYVRLLISHFIKGASNYVPRNPIQDRQRWFHVPMILFFTCFVALVGIPRWIVIIVSWPAMQDLVVRFEQGERFSPSFVGLIAVERVDHFKDGFQLVIPSEGLGGEPAGFIYVAGQEPVTWDQRYDVSGGAEIWSYAHYHGDWHRCWVTYD